MSNKTEEQVRAETYEKVEKEYREKLRKEDEKIIKKTEGEIERYYFWVWHRGYGWRQFGCQEGYRTIKEAKKESTFYRKEKDPVRITKSVII